MLRSVKVMLGYRLDATDGELGRTKDFYFDDHDWAVRYLVVDTGNWLPKRRVLISPTPAGEPNWKGQVIPVSLTKKQVEDSPSIQSDRPVSRQEEEQLAAYYNWPAYWAPAAIPGAGMMPPAALLRKPAEGQTPKEREPRGDPDLRSVKEVLGYHIHATDGEIGHVDDFIAETDNWAVRYLVVDTRNWLPGKRVLVAPAWIGDVSWAEREVHVRLSRQAVKDCPEFDPSAPVNREYEARLYDYYGVPKYWEQEGR